MPPGLLQAAHPGKVPEPTCSAAGCRSSASYALMARRMRDSTCERRIRIADADGPLITARRAADLHGHDTYGTGPMRHADLDLLSRWLFLAEYAAKFSDPEPVAPGYERYGSGRSAGLSAWLFPCNAALPPPTHQRLCPPWRDVVTLPAKQKRTASAGRGSPRLTISRTNPPSRASRTLWTPSHGGTTPRRHRDPRQGCQSRRSRPSWDVDQLD